MSPQQSTFRHAESFTYGLTPASGCNGQGHNATANAQQYSTPQQGPHFYLPSTPKSSCQSTLTLNTGNQSSRRRHAGGNRPRSVALFPPNTSQPPPPLVVPHHNHNYHPKMNVSHSAPLMVPSHGASYHNQSNQHQQQSCTTGVLHQSYSFSSYASCRHSPQQQQYAPKKILRNGSSSHQHGSNNNSGNHRAALSDSRSGSPTACFAGAKFSESPKAQLIPLPPSQWLSYSEGSNASDSSNSIEAVSSSASISRKSSTTSTTDDSRYECDFGLNVPAVTPTALQSSSSASTACRSGNGGPIRMNPLQLIAAVAAS